MSIFNIYSGSCNSLSYINYLENEIYNEIALRKFDCLGHIVAEGQFMDD